jgi:hypothetical protein
MDDLIQLAIEPAAWAALATLIVMEVVLGIDNLIFISILTNKLPAENRTRARRIGIGAALVLRLVLLGTVAFIIRLTQPIFTLLAHSFSWRDLILIGGGLFLVWKATKEIHQKVDSDGDDLFSATGKKAAFGAAAAIGQILVLDLVFSIDSIITAVGMTDELPIMIIAVLVAVTLTLRPYWKPPQTVELQPHERGGHGGADSRMTAVLLGGRTDPMGRSATGRDGSLALLTGLAANRSLQTAGPVRVADLLDLPERAS